MKAIELDLYEFNFYCPVTGTHILSEDEYKPSPAQLAFWISDEVSNEPEFYDNAIKSRWQSWVDDNENNEDFSYDVVEFLSTLDEPKWVAFRLECGSAIMQETSTLLINMHYQKS